MKFSMRPGAQEIYFSPENNIVYRYQVRGQAIVPHTDGSVHWRTLRNEDMRLSKISGVQNLLDVNEWLNVSVFDLVTQKDVTSQFKIKLGKV